MNSKITELMANHGTTIDAIFKRFLDTIESPTFVSYFSYQKVIV